MPGSGLSDADSNLSAETQELLRTRYGRGRTNKNLWKIAAAISMMIFIPWLIWSAWHHSNPEIRVSLISFQNESDNSIDITYRVERRDPSTPVSCTLLARDIDKNVVGEIEDYLPPAKTDVVTKTTTIPARITPVNAAVLECRAAQD